MRNGFPERLEEGPRARPGDQDSREGRDLVCPGTPSSTIPCPCPTLRASHSVSKLSSHPPALHQPPPHSPPFCLCSLGGDHLPTPTATPTGLASPSRWRAGTQSCREDSWCWLRGLPAHGCKAPPHNPKDKARGRGGQGGQQPLSMVLKRPHLGSSGLRGWPHPGLGSAEPLRSV